MSFQKLSTGLIIISLTILGCVYSQNITIPLKLNQEGQLIFSVEYGLKLCPIDAFPSLSYCTNIISKDAHPEVCGIKKIGRSTYTVGDDQTAPFQLGFGEYLFQLTYTVPDYSDNKNVICFGWDNQIEGSYSALQQLFKAKQITESRVYFSLDSQKYQKGFIGEVNIGAPNKSLIKKGAQIVGLSNKGSFNTYHTYSQGDLKFFGDQLDCPNGVAFSTEPFYLFSQEAFNNILSILQKQGVQYSYFENQQYKVLLPSIEKLQSFTITFIQKNDTQYPITIKPSQYTRKLDNGQYQLMIRPSSIDLDSNQAITLGFSIFETYYVGFDAILQSVFIAEKEEHQFSNFI